MTPTPSQPTPRDDRGYYRYPALHGDTLVFTCEEDLWQVPASGGTPRRLTAGLGESTHAHFSPDGEHIAFTARDEGHVEVYVMAADGGEATRLTFLGAVSLVAGWSPDGTEIYFASTTQQPFQRVQNLFAISREGGAARPLGWGPARHLAHDPAGRGLVIGRNTGDPARWKRYRGGTAGDLWIDATGSGRFARLAVKVGNPTTPMWLGGRVYFLADHEGTGNLYSCLPDGQDLKRHTDHADYYARQASTDGRRITYHAGADVYVFDPASNTSSVVPIAWRSPAPQRARRFVDAASFTDGLDLHPKGHTLALASRGKPFTLGAFAGAVMQHGTPQGVRYRLPTWLADGRRVVVVQDAEGEERLSVLTIEAAKPVDKEAAAGSPVAELLAPGTEVPLAEGALGRVIELKAAPWGDRLVLVNNRNELILVDVATRTMKLLDASNNSHSSGAFVPTGTLSGACWSPDGRWVAYSCPISRSKYAIKVVNVESGEVTQVTEPVVIDTAPAWDPKGRYLYFLSHRHFDPVYDNLHFELGFPKGVRPALVTLRADVASPFVPKVEPEEEDEEGKDDAKEGDKDGPKDATQPEAKQDAKGEGDSDSQAKKKDPKKPDEPPKPLVIELDGIRRRIALFPLPEARYTQILGLEAKVLLVSHEPRGALENDFVPSNEARSVLQAYDYATQKAETLIDAMTWVALTLDAKTMLVLVGERVRVLAAGEKPKAESETPGRESGWVDLARVRVSIDPRAEWRQMYNEAWRLQRDQFWTADMSQIDWQQVHARYLPLLARVATRGEFSDLLWEMQGELGTSHAYEWGGDYRPVTRYEQGHLGADFVWDTERQGYRLTHVVDGDPGEAGKDSPLRRVGLGVGVGDVLVAVGGRPLSPTFDPRQALVHQAKTEVALTFAPHGDKPARTVVVRTLAGEWGARYREWVETNRAKVHAATNGKIGYVHIPDMGPLGYAEFHRGFLTESERDGLVVDVRNNGGGHVSQLVLEKLARKRLGYDVSRYGPPVPYPDHSMEGPLVGLTNEVAGSDGDIFSHCFRLMGLGPLLGKRTWGGVIGIWPRHALVDGTYTTQPEYSFWFKDVGWGVENYGAEPDVDVDNAPHDYQAGVDAQLDLAIQTALDLLAAKPPITPTFADRPNLAAPKLPPR